MANKKILLVDNMELALQMEEEILRRSGLDILTASSGTEALELVKSQRPDLVLLESNMPEMSGYDCCRAIKADPALQKTPVIIMLTESTPEIVDQCYEANCEDVLTKPLDQDAVLSKISALLEIKTRKLPRLQIKTPVRIERTGRALTVESINLNRQGILVSSPEAFDANENFRLSFAVSPADQTVSMWSRLDRQVEPGHEKNPGETYLVLFRFLAVAQKVADRIDQLATFQAQQAGKTPTGMPAAGRLTGLEISFKTPLASYQPLLESLLKNINAPMAGLDEKSQTTLRMVAASFKPWEKTGKPSDPDTDVLRASLRVRMKLAVDFKALEALPQLSSEEQQTLRTLQTHYFKELDQVLEQLQTRINAQMQAGQVDRMKELNQSKTETFRLMVGFKSLLNRIIDPKAAIEASNFRYEATDQDVYKQEAFERPKPVEEAPKAQEFVFDKKKKKGNSPMTIGITLFLTFVALPAAIYYALNAKPIGVVPSEEPEAKIELQTPLPIARIKERAGIVTIYVTPAWEQMPRDQRVTLINAVNKEIRAKGFAGFQMFGNSGLPQYARGNRKGALDIYETP